jgi:prepilin-type N-terminal cleavage/methylation domain-containing protein
MITPTTQQRHRTRRQGGFSLVELLIVVAVILIIAAIAIPNFVRSRMRANEASAVQNLRNITTANTVYLTTYGIGFSTNLTKLGGNLVIVDSNNAGLIDSVLATGVKSGYSFSYSVTASDTLGNPVGYSVSASPLTVGTTGENYFYIDQSAIIRHNTTTTATASDPAI